MMLKPSNITLTQALSRVEDIRELAKINDKEEAVREQQQLFMDVLHTIAQAPTMADKRELKRLAGVALEGYDALSWGEHPDGPDPIRDEVWGKAISKLKK